jgi:putative addiction module component (TIGR02574 family)
MDDASDLPLPDWLQQLLDERIAEDDADPEAGSSWEEVKVRILSDLAR